MSFYRAGMGDLQGKQDIRGWSGSFNCEEIVIRSSEIMKIVQIVIKYNKNNYKNNY